MRFFLVSIFLFGLSLLLEAAAFGRSLEAWPEQGTYPYCVKDSCRTAFDGLNTFFFGTLPKEVRANCVDPKAYAMTFDDGPSVHWPEVLELLNRRNIKATFFVVGRNLTSPENRALLLRAHREGQQISNHSLSHPDLMKESDAEVLRQVKTTEDAIVEILGDSANVRRDAKIVRPPFGYIDARVQGIFRANGFRSVRWNSDRSDWELDEAKADLALKRLAEHLSYIKKQDAINQSVLDLNHDFSGATRATLNAAIDRIEAEGYRFVTVSECLGLSSP